MKKFMTIGFLSLFFITTNISYSDYNMDTIKDEYHSKSSLNDSFDLVYSNIKIKNDELIFRQEVIQESEMQ